MSIAAPYAQSRPRLSVVPGFKPALGFTLFYLSVRTGWSVRTMNGSPTKVSATRMPSGV